MMLTHCKTAGFKDIYMSADSNGKRKTRNFLNTPLRDDGIFCQISYASGRDDAEITLDVIYANENGEVDDSVKVVQADAGNIFLSQGDGDLTIQLAIRPDGDDTGEPLPQGPWKTGTYQVTFFIDGKKEDSIKFQCADSYDE